MMPVEESLPASEITKDLNTGTTFIGYGSEQVIQNNGWVTVWNLGKGVQGSGTVVHMNSFKPSTVRCLPAQPVDSSTADPVSVSSVCELPEVSSAGSTSVECVDDDVHATGLLSMFGRDELAPKTTLDTSLAEAVCDKDSSPTVLKTVLSFQTSVHDKTCEMSLIKQIERRNDSDLGDSFLNDKSNYEENASSNKQSRPSVDVVALTDNNNYKDAVALEAVKADKAAARLQLNAVLQNEISKTVKTKLADAAVCSAETKPSGFTGGQANRSFINLSGQPRFVVKQNSAGGLRTNENMTQVVRIQNAKVVGVFEAEKKDFTPAATAPTPTPLISRPVDASSGTIAVEHENQNKVLVRTGRLETANDASKKCTSTRYVVFTPLLCNNTVEAKTDCSVVHPQDFDLLDRANDGTSFVFDPLCISADTLVPVAGTASHGERQNVDMGNSICLQQNEGMKNSCREDAPGDSEVTMLRCFLCPFFHEKQSKIAEHWIDAHLRQLPYVCSYCDNGFTTSWEVQKHIVRFHPGEKIKVGIRNSTHFASSLAYEVVRSDGVEAPATDVENVIFVRQSLHACRKCDFQCETSAELRSHQRSFHFKFKPYFCTYCTGKKVSFACGFDLKQHIRVHHPERMLAAAGRPLRDPAVPRLTADINWSSTYEAISIANQVLFQCRTCAFRTQLLESAWKHVLLSHNWPETVNCPSCAHSFELTGVERESFLASCGKCQVPIYLGPDAADARLNGRGEPVFMCTICDYKTMGKGSMNRHLKYNHTKCRPYGCVYCNYVAVERPKVKLHIESLHKGQKIAIKERTESSEGFRRLVEDLFSSIVRVGYYSELSAGASAVNLGGQSTEKESDVDDGLKSWKRMKLNRAEDDNLDIMMCPNSPTEADFELTAQARDRDRDRKSINGEHFKCMICGYVCTDRSCMSRHIKYMHITSRPHSCPYCRYNNVEKTKVRLHVKSHHPSQPKCVKTNKKLLEDMSSEAKKFYVKVDSAGQVMKDSNLLSLQPNNLSSEVGLDESVVDMQDSGDSTTNEFFLTELDPEADFIDVQTTGQGAATVVLKEGVYQVGIKEEPNCDDDDVRIKEEQQRVKTSSNVSLYSNALDHSYVSDLLDVVTPPRSDLVTNIKTEPEDTGYDKVTPDESFPAESGVSVSKTFTDYYDSDESSDGSLAGVTFGAADAVHLDGFNGLEDSSEDDLDEDSDLDLLDLADFELDESSLPNVGVATRRWEFSEQQAEHSRLQLLQQVEMDDDVREDAKIWMRCVVIVEDIISRISANKPIIDM